MEIAQKEFGFSQNSLKLIFIKVQFMAAKTIMLMFLNA